MPVSGVFGLVLVILDFVSIIGGLDVLCVSGVGFSVGLMCYGFLGFGLVFVVGWFGWGACFRVFRVLLLVGGVWCRIVGCVFSWDLMFLGVLV